MYLLALEASTTSAKAMLYDTVSGKFQVKIKAYPRMYGDSTLQDPEKVFACMVQVGREAARGKKVEMISLVNAWHSILLCDRDMRPVTPVLPWSYTGAAGLCSELRKDKAYVKEYYGKTGCMVNATYPFFKLLLLKEKGYDLKDYFVTGQGEYNTYRLTGEKVLTACLASGGGLLDIYSKEYVDLVHTQLGLGEENLPELVPYRQVYPLSREGAGLLQLEEGIPVVPANSDGGLNQIGVGALEEGVMTLSVGTSGAMRLSVPEPKLPDNPHTWCYLSPKSYLSGAATAGCCNCIDWFCKDFLQDAFTYEQLESTEEEKEEILHTPIFLPFLYGERCPGWDDKREGGFVKITGGHQLPDLYRGIQQGILFNLYHCYRLLAQTNGVPKKIKLSGGILHSRRWPQMCADIFQVPMEVDTTEQGSLLGGIVLAMELAGVIPDAAQWTPDSGGRLIPNAEKAEIYQQQYQKYIHYYELL